jgi:hypothetical protein
MYSFTLEEQARVAQQVRYNLHSNIVDQRQQDANSIEQNSNPVSVFRAGAHSHKLALRKQQKDLKKLEEIKQQNGGILSTTVDLSLLNGDDTGSNTTIDGVTNYNRILAARGALAVEKRKELVKRVRKEELAGCTFIPHVNKPKSKASQQQQQQHLQQTHDSLLSSPSGQEFQFLSQQQSQQEHHSPGSPLGRSPSKNMHSDTAAVVATADSEEAVVVFDRLYARRKEKPQQPLSDASNGKLFAEQIAAELEPCTFTPTLPSSQLYLQNKKKAAEVPISDVVGGFDKNVQRLRQVTEKKLKEKEDEEKAHLVEHEKYLKSREIAKQGFAPFSFTLAQRRQAEEQARLNKKQPAK